jgi:hypothetical protein
MSAPAELTGAICQCSTCPRTGLDYYVQPQPDGTYRCSDCHNRAVEQWRAERKAELAALPRCSCCKRRGTWNVAGILLCGHHKKAVERARYAETKGTPAFLLMFGAAPISREHVLRLAQS